MDTAPTLVQQHVWCAACHAAECLTVSSSFLFLLRIVIHGHAQVKRRILTGCFVLCESAYHDYYELAIEVYQRYVFAVVRVKISPLQGTGGGKCICLYLVPHFASVTHAASRLPPPPRGVYV